MMNTGISGITWFLLRVHTNRSHENQNYLSSTYQLSDGEIFKEKRQHTSGAPLSLSGLINK